VNNVLADGRVWNIKNPVISQKITRFSNIINAKLGGMVA